MKKTYETPKLVEYGTVEELTQGNLAGEADAVVPGSGVDL
jgi:hypothetical protein